MSDAMEYCSDELDAMAYAVNYYRTIISYARPHLGRVVVEHGAGIGTFSRFLLAEPIASLIAVEPAANLLPMLRERLRRWGDRVRIVASTLETFAAAPDAPPIDAIVSVNVLEHIADDRATLAAMRRLVRPGGHVIVFVPAVPALYGSLDRAFGHVRRYRRAELRAKVAGAGLDVVTDRFMNLPGTLAWLVVGRVVRSRTLRRRGVRFYDRWIVPVVSALERRLAPPFGQGLFLVARRADGAGAPSAGVRA